MAGFINAFAILSVFLCTLQAIVDASCVPSNLMRIDYVVTEKNVSSRKYPLVNNTFNLLRADCRATGREVVFSFRPTTSAQFILKTANDGIDTVMNLLDTNGCVSQCNDDEVPSVITSSRLVMTGVVGQEYLIVIEAFFSVETRSLNFTIDLVTTLAPTSRPTAPPITLPPTMTNISQTFTIFSVPEIKNVLQQASASAPLLIIVESDLNLNGVALVIPPRLNVSIISRMQTMSVRSDESDMGVTTLPSSFILGNASGNLTAEGGFILLNASYIAILGDPRGSLRSALGITMTRNPGITLALSLTSVETGILGAPGRLMLKTRFWSVGDINGDGYPDLALETNDATLLRIVYGGQDLSRSLDDAFGFTVSIVQTNTTIAIFDVGVAGDFDGIMDFFISYSATSFGLQSTNAALVYGSKDRKDMVLASAGSQRVLLIQPDFDDGDIMVITRAGDLNSDGYDDLLIGRPSFDRLYIVYGQGNRVLADYFLSPNTDFSFEDQNLLSRLGSSVAEPGDFDRNGQLDLATGAPMGFAGKGAVYVMMNREFKGRLIASISDIISEFAQPRACELVSDIYFSCGRIVKTADLDQDGNDDLVIGCSQVLLVVFGDSLIAQSSIQLSSLMDGTKGFVVRLGADPIKIDIFKKFTAAPDVVVLTANGSVIYLNELGKKRKQRNPAFVLGDRANLFIDSIRFDGTFSLVDGSSATTSRVTTRNVVMTIPGQASVPKCPQGFLPASSILQNETRCSSDWWCPSSANSSSIITQIPVFPTMPLNPSRIILSGTRQGLLVFFQGSRLLGRFFNGQQGFNDATQFVITETLATQSSSLLLQTSDFNFGRIEGSFPLWFDLVATGEAEYLVMFIDQDMTIKGRTINAISKTATPAFAISSRRIVVNLQSVGTQRLALISTTTSSTSRGVVFLGLTFRDTNNTKGGWMTVSTDSGKSFRDIPFLLQATLDQWPDFELFISPPATPDGDSTAFGGHLMSCVDESTGSLLVMSMVNYDSGVFRSMFVDPQARNYTNAPSLIVGTIATFHPRLIFANNSFVVVAIAGSLMRMYTLQHGALTWQPGGILSSTVMQFSSSFDVSVDRSSIQDIVVVAFAPASEQSVFVLSRVFSNISTASWSPTNFVLNITGATSLETGFDIGVRIFPSVQAIVTTNLVLDSLSRIDPSSQEPNVIREAMGDYAGFVSQGLPVQTILRWANYSANPTRKCFKDTISDVCSVAALCEGLRCGDAPLSSLCVGGSLEITPSSVVIDVTPPLFANALFTIDNLRGTRAGRILLLDEVSNANILVENTQRPLDHVNAAYIPAGGSTSIRIQTDRLEPFSLHFVAFLDDGSYVNLAVNVSFNRILPVTFPSRLLLQSTVGSSALVTASLGFTNVVSTAGLVMRAFACDSFLSVDSLYSTFRPLRPSQSVSVGIAVNATEIPSDLPFILSCVRFDYAYVDVSGLTNNNTFFQSLNVPVNVTLVKTGGRIEDCRPGEFFTSGACVACGTGSFQPNPASSECMLCPASLPLTSASGSKDQDSCQAGPNSVKFNASLGLQCPFGADCSSPSNLETLKLLPGYWRASTQSTVTFRCRRHREFCIGNTNVSTITPAPDGRRLESRLPTDSVCRPGHTGILCEGCLEGYALRSPNGCEVCDAAKTETDRNRALGIYLGIAFIFIIVVLGCQAIATRSDWWTMSEGQNDLRSADDRFDYSAYGILLTLGMKLRLIVSLLQVASLFAINSPELFPNEVQNFMSAFGIFYLDPFATLNLGCAFAGTMPNNPLYSTLLVSTIAPIVGVVVVFAIHCVVLCFAKTDDVRQRMFKVSVSFAVGLVWLFYPGTSNTILRMLTCGDFEKYFRGVLADLSISCGGSTWQAYQSYAAAMVVLFIVLFPFGLLYVLFSQRIRLNPLSTGCLLYSYDRDGVLQRNEDGSIDHLRFLFAPYEPFFFWFEILDLMRKLFQTGIPTLLPTIKGQILFQFGATLVGSFLLIELKPYTNPGDDMLASLCQITLSAISLYSLVTVFDPAFINFSQANVALFCLIFIPIAFAVAQLLEHAFRAYDRRGPPRAAVKEQSHAPSCELPRGWCSCCLGSKRDSMGGFAGKFDIELERERVKNTISMT